MKGKMRSSRLFLSEFRGKALENLVYNLANLIRAGDGYNKQSLTTAA
jgi:hypothetical protein